MSKHTNNHDLYEDLEKIKAALRVASEDVKFKAGDILAQSLEDAEDRADAIKSSVCNYIEEKPLKSLGIAALLGVVVGMYIKKQ